MGGRFQARCSTQYIQFTKRILHPCRAPLRCVSMMCCFVGNEAGSRTAHNLILLPRQQTLGARYR